MNKYGISRANAKVLLGLAGVLTVLNLTELDDFIYLMLELEEYITLPEYTSVDHLLRLLGSCDDDF